MTPENILNDPSASDWLKNALRSALNRDVLDAERDAEILFKVLHAEMVKVLFPASPVAR
jgi:hypothetical protein